MTTTTRLFSHTTRTTLVCVALVTSMALVWQFQLGLELSLSVVDSSSSSSLLSSNLLAVELDRPGLDPIHNPTTLAAVPLQHPANHKNNNHNKNKTVWWPHSLIQDQTLEWDPKVYRPWLDPNAPPPPAVIVLTSFGWNHWNQTWARTIPRSIRETELFTGIINHPWFHPTLWEELEQLYQKRRRRPPGPITNRRTTRFPLPNTTTRLYVFLDRPQCGESNYPIYNGGRPANMDVTLGRPSGGGTPYVTPLVPSHNPLWTSRTFSRLRQTFSTMALLFNCNGYGLGAFPEPQQRRVSGFLSNASYLSIATLSSLIRDVQEEVDQGLVPPMPHPCQLTDQQVHDIATCAAETNRPFFFVYAGNFRNGNNVDFERQHGGGARSSYQPLNDNQRIFVTPYSNASEFHRSALSKYSYAQFLARSVFALAARGDNKFSYRFSEVLSAGAIPVVHADEWVWPFRPELVNWTACAVIRPEQDAGKTTVAYLDTISVEQRCRMRQACYRIYKDYVETTVGTIHGLVQGLELLQTQRHEGGSPLKLQGVRCDEFVNPSRDCNLQR